MLCRGVGRRTRRCMPTDTQLERCWTAADAKRNAERTILDTLFSFFPSYSPSFLISFSRLVIMLHTFSFLFFCTHFLWFVGT